MEIAFRKGNTGDIDNIAGLEKICFHDPWSRESVRNEIENNDLAEYAVITADGKFAGYGGYWTIGDEGHITNIAIDPGYRGKGLGTLLVKHIMEDEGNINLHGFTLEVRVSNEPAIKLYEKLGFKNEGVRPGYYTDGEDAIIMWYRR